MDKKYILKPILGTIKEGFLLVDENNNIVYECKMKKFSLFGAAPYEFKNYITNKVEEYKIGKTITATESGLFDFISTTSTFKFNNENIWHYLHNKGVRINSNFSSNKIGMTYNVSFEGKPLAIISTSSQKGKSLITTDKYFDITCDEKNIDLVFLIAFSIAKTDQIFYD